MTKPEKFRGWPVKQAFTLHLTRVSFSATYSEFKVTQKPAKKPLPDEYAIGLLSCSKCWIKEPSGLASYSLSCANWSEGRGQRKVENGKFTDHLGEGVGSYVRPDVEATGRAGDVGGTVGRRERRSHPVSV